MEKIAHILEPNGQTLKGFIEMKRAEKARKNAKAAYQANLIKMAAALAAERKH